VLASFPILDYNRDAAEWHARERARLEVSGKTPPFVDAQIAAIACVNNLVLVTANQPDFPRFSWAHGPKLELTAAPSREKCPEDHIGGTSRSACSGRLTGVESTTFNGGAE
jgi:hypothetical protein